MADNTLLNPGTGGDTIATEDIGGVKVPVTKIVIGAHGVNDGPVTSDNPLPVLGEAMLMTGFYPYGQAPSGPSAPLLDEWGSLQTRSAIVTDAGSCSDDFDAMSTALSGTLTFTNASDQVTGTLSVFGTELDRTRYVKLDSDGEDYWTLVSSIEDDGHITLANQYQGTGGTGAASWSFWRTHTPAGATIAAASSICTLTAPTTTSTNTYIWHDADYGPISTQLKVAVSQRIAHQVITIAFQDSAETPSSRACFVLDGTDATVVKCLCASSSATGSQVAATCNLPTGTTTADSLTYEVRIWSHTVAFYVNGVLLTTMGYTIPIPNTIVGLLIGIANSSPVGSQTTVSVHWMHYDDTERVDVLASQPDASKMHVTAQGPDASGADPTGKPILIAATDSVGHVTVPRIVDTLRNVVTSIADPATTAAIAAVKVADTVLGTEYGVTANAFVTDLALAIKRPLKLIADTLAMAQDQVSGRVRALADINSGTLTTCSTVTTVTTVTSMTNINAQSAQTTLLYGVELGTWANAVRSRIT